MENVSISSANKSYLSKQNNDNRVEQEQPKTSNTKPNGEKYILAGLAALATAGVVAFSIAKKMRGKSVAPTPKEARQLQEAGQNIPQKIRKFINNADIEIDNVKLTNGLYKTDDGNLFTGTYSRTLKDGRVATMKIADGKKVSVSLDGIVKEYKTFTLPESSLGELTQTGFTKSKKGNYPFYEKFSITTDDGRLYRRAVTDKNADASSKILKFEEYDLEAQKQNPNLRLIKAKGKCDLSGEIKSIDIYDPKTGKAVQKIEEIGMGSIKISTPLKDGTIKEVFKDKTSHGFHYYTPIEQATSKKPNCVILRDKDGNISRKIERNTNGWEMLDGEESIELVHIDGRPGSFLRFDDLNKSSHELPPKITINPDGSISTLHNRKLEAKDKDFLKRQYEKLVKTLKDEGMEEIPSDIQKNFKKALFGTPSSRSTSAVSSPKKHSKGNRLLGFMRRN